MKKHLISIGLILTAIIIGLIAYPSLPEQLPIHWNSAGEIDGYSSKLFGVLFAPAIMAAMYAMFQLLPKIDPKKENYKKFKGSYEIIVYSVFVLMFGVHFITIGTGLGYNIPVETVIPVAVGGLFIILGNYMQRVKQNFFVGVKTPWALANEEVWNKTQRLGARMFVLGGFFMIAVVFLPAEWRTVATLATIGLIVIIPTVGSYVYYKKLEK